MRTRPALLAEGVTAWLRAEEGPYADAASEVVAELAIRGLLYLKALEEAGK